MLDTTSRGTGVVVMQAEQSPAHEDAGTVTVELLSCGDRLECFEAH